MIKKRNTIFLLFLLIYIFSSEVYSQKNIRIMFYNVENMFDISDNPLKEDDDFTPKGQLRWSGYRYRKKVNDIARVISSVKGKSSLSLVGLCEVENDSVLHDLTQKTVLKKERYKYMVTNSKDIRGSNVGLLYQEAHFKLLNTITYTPIIDKEQNKSTRNILHAVGRILNGDTLDIFVCHFPSRREGIKRTRPYRMICADLLKQKTDSIFNIRSNPSILIMGDFNDTPTDSSVYETLQAKSLLSDIKRDKLYNMFHHSTEDKTKGTYKYRGKWSYLDQFIVSGNLLMEKNPVTVLNKKVHIFKEDFLLENDVKYGGVKPLRTYSGYRYLGGASDHLPIYIDLKIKTPDD